jgi:hypothetical protein
VVVARLNQAALAYGILSEAAQEIRVAFFV